MFFVEVIGPLDAVYVGPFRDAREAADHADAIRVRHGLFDTAVMTKPQMDAAIMEYGSIPLQAPEQWT